MENINEEQWWEMSEKIHQAMEPTLEEVYAKWQSQPTTEEQWDEMSSEIQRATKREFEKEKYNTLKKVYKKWQSQPVTEKDESVPERKPNTPVLVISDEENEPVSDEEDDHPNRPKKQKNTL
jgi:hypothetical protein